MLGVTAENAPSLFGFSAPSFCEGVASVELGDADEHWPPAASGYCFIGLERSNNKSRRFGTRFLSEHAVPHLPRQRQQVI